jgi:S-adenosylmethionine uptake transporter
MESSMIGITWFILSLIISGVNDVLMKYLTLNLSSFEVVFLRFFVSTLTLLPFIRNKQSLHTNHLSLHAFRGLLLFGGIWLWCLGLSGSKVTVATVINLTIPIFVLVLARIFLKEKVTLPKVIAVALGFIGTIVVINPTQLETNSYSLLFVIAVTMFAALDVINKKFVTRESILSMLFYSSLFTTLFSVGPAVYTWTWPSWMDIGLCCLLGVLANLILYCLLKAYAEREVSELAPYRYICIELIATSSLGYLVFGESVDRSTIAGAAVIVVALVILTLSIVQRKARV